MVTGRNLMRGRDPVAVRRKPSPQQGRSLEILGHAIEYLMDSYVITASPNGGRADQEAIHMLSRLNLDVFSECPEIVPYHQRLWAHLVRRVFLIRSCLSWSEAEDSMPDFPAHGRYPFENHPTRTREQLTESPHRPR